MSNYGLIGKRLDYSFSKAYFENKFQKENIEASYENLELPDLSDLRERVKDLDGFNVTIPFKEEILSNLDALDAEAEAIGAVNTVKMEEGKMKGYNTDHYGFATSLKPFLTNMHEKALIIGSGGASKAVIYALEKLGIKCFVLSRS